LHRQAKKGREAELRRLLEAALRLVDGGMPCVNINGL
jgi:hypothetical protein